MSSIVQFLPILALFFLLIDNFIHTCAGNFPNPHSPINKFADYEQDSNYSYPKLGKPVFGRINTIATAVTVAITLLSILVCKLREIHEANLREKYKPSKQSCRRFLLADILSATKNFDNSLVVGQGGFGKVYRGEIIDDDEEEEEKIIVAIKRLNPMSKQGATEFKAEIEMLSRIRHSNIVSLIGYCDDCDEMILIYEFMVRGTLADNIHKNSTLPWAERVKICIGAAHGLDYLHTGTGDRSRIIHRDIKSSNILLGENWTAKISDFGLSKIGPKNQVNSHVSTNVKGTFGYVDPEYFLTQQLTRKSDVYAFGVVLFEVLCGRRAVDLSLDLERRALVGWAQDCVKEGNLDDIIDPNLRGRLLQDSLTAFVQIADQCLHKFPAERPTMAEVVVALELALIKQERIDFPFFGDEFFNIGGNDNDPAGFSNKEESVINQENAHSSVKEQVFIDSNDKESRAKAPRMMTFTKLVRQFIFGTSTVISAHSEVKNSNSDNSSAESVTLSSGDPNLKKFKYGDLVVATKNFRRDMMMGEGRYGKVYKGWVLERTNTETSTAGTGIIVAVKKLCMPFLRFYSLKEGSLESHLFRSKLYIHSSKVHTATKASISLPRPPSLLASKYWKIMFNFSIVSAETAFSFFIRIKLFCLFWQSVPYIHRCFLTFTCNQPSHSRKSLVWIWSRRMVFFVREVGNVMGWELTCIDEKRCIEEEDEEE